MHRHRNFRRMADKLGMSRLTDENVYRLPRLAEVINRIEHYRPSARSAVQAARIESTTAGTDDRIRLASIRVSEEVRQVVRTAAVEATGRIESSGYRSRVTYGDP